MKNVLEYLEQSAQRNPLKTAVLDPDSSCDYMTLETRAKQIGTKLSKLVKPRQPVVCYMDKSVQCLQAFFGIVYSGCFYTLLDPSFPEDRVHQILEVLEPAAILTTHAYDGEVGKLKGCQPIYLEDIGTEIDQDLLARRRAGANDTDPLYCNFTSGSTGVPKGVLVCHRSVIDFINVFTDRFGITGEDVIGNQAPFDFDVSVKDIYPAMKTGATLVIIPKAYFMSPVKVIDMLEDNSVTTMTWAVSALCMLIRLHGFKYKVPHAINRIMFSGEVMPIKQFNKLKKIYPDILYVNLYGPTEITCNCTYHILDREYGEGDKMPVGIPFDNETVFLLDENDQAVEGEGVGEICVSGTALALGYYNNPETTAKAFCQNPLNKKYPETIYRTGDLGYFQDGLLYFCGRKDFQIKHMGHRIELEEIETVLGNVTGISHACCAYDQERNKVVGFYVGDTDKAQIVEQMKAKVPEYMVPNVLQSVDTMPLTKNGKTDRKTLFARYKEGTL